jgi:hypothetical protein
VLAGGGVRQAFFILTDEYGYFAVENKVRSRSARNDSALVRLDHTKLTYPFSRNMRLTDVQVVS